MKYVYNFHKDTGEYLGAEEAALDIEETKISERGQGGPVYLLPANATFTEPPAVETEQIAVYKEADRVWGKRTDLRGIRYYRRTDGNDVGIIDSIGKRIPTGCTRVPPPFKLKKPKRVNGAWKEGGLIFYGKAVTTRAQVKRIVRLRLTRDMGEQKAKTLYILTLKNEAKCPEWVAFIAARQELINEANQFIADNNLV